MENVSLDITQLLNYGSLGVITAYFMWLVNTTLKQLQATMQSLKEIILVMNAKLGIETKEEVKENE